jgi:hypothetical protein
VGCAVPFGYNAEQVFIRKRTQSRESVWRLVRPTCGAWTGRATQSALATDPQRSLGVPRSGWNAAIGDLTTAIARKALAGAYSSAERGCCPQPSPSPSRIMTEQGRELSAMRERTAINIGIGEFADELPPFAGGQLQMNNGRTQFSFIYGPFTLMIGNPPENGPPLPLLWCAT